MGESLGNTRFYPCERAAIGLSHVSMSPTAEKGAPPPATEQGPPAVAETPQRDEPVKEKSIAGGCLSVVVLGASGDLAKKKTFPAIFNLYKQVECPPKS